MAETKELATVQSFALATLDREAVAEEMDGLAITFDRVRIPSGGALVFELPGETEEDVETVKELVGVIVDHHPVNAYWKDLYSGQGNPPDCASMDGKLGVARPESGLEWAGKRMMACAECPLNRFGSDGGRGKACKNMHRIYLLREGSPFPLLLTLPPTSLKNFAQYLAKRVVTKGLRSYGVVTRVSLKKAQNATGIAYSQAVFSLAGVLTPELTEQMRKYSESIRPVTRGLGLTSEDYEVSADSENGDSDPF